MGIDSARLGLRLFSFILILFAGLSAMAQIVFPIHLHDGQTVETCAGYFVDSGGDTLTHYGQDEGYSLSFCSDEGTLMVLSFHFFELAEGDFMYIYDGASADSPLLREAGGSSLAGQTIYASGSCLHISFVSSGEETGRGWLAEIGCMPLCDTFIATIEDVSGTRFCPQSPGTAGFSASAVYLPELFDANPSAYQYSWSSRQVQYTGAQVQIPYDEPGAYPVTLLVSDPQTGCVAEAATLFKVGTVPEFRGTTPSVESACAGESFSLLGMVQPLTWAGFSVEVMETIAIPDGTGDVYESTLTFDVFSSDDLIETPRDIGGICLYIEHVDYGQLEFELESPDGKRILLHTYSEGGANLGEPVIWDGVTPGKAYMYCFTPESEFGLMEETSPRFHSYTDNAGNYYFNAPHLPSGSYRSKESLAVLAGSPLNGSWTLRVKDNIPGNGNGFMMGWRLLFHEDFYTDSLMFTPEITSFQWFRNSTQLTGNPASSRIDEAGSYVFRFEVSDNFGCVFDTLVHVDIKPLPRAEIVSEAELPFCEGDSTWLTVIPSGESNMHWTYQWMRGTAELPGRTYDTLMVNQPAIYTVMVLDTLTTCMGFFDINVDERNCDLTVPNVFTPNGDGINDVFEILNLEHYPGAQMVIFNRWGKKVFEHHDYYNNWWDGRDQPDGVYFYVLKYLRAGKMRYIEGAVSIVR
jgi:large repetitive protein